MSREVTIQVNNASLLAWSIYKFGDKVMGDTDEISTSADKDRLMLYKKLFSVWDADKNKYVEPALWVELKSAYNEIGTELRRRSMPLYTFTGNVKRIRRGLRIVNVKTIPELERIIEVKEKLAKEALEKFLGIYPQLIENAKVVLGGQFNDDDFPTANNLRSRFGVSWSYLPFGQPSNLPKEVLERELKAEIESNKATAQECRLALRQGLLALVEHLGDMLKPNSTLKRKCFASNLDKIVEFQKLLSFTDMTDDQELRNISQKATELIANATPEALKNSGDIAKTVLKGAEEIANTLKEMVVDVKGRKFSFTDDQD